MSILSLRKILWLLFFTLLSFNVFSQPVITSFAPGSGQVGATVTINGTGFSSDPLSNMVFFGAVKANVISASANVLSVRVPTGTTYQPITVTTNGLTAYSAKPFIVTFPGGGLTNASFDMPVNDSTDYHPNGIVVADFDGDGKADIATANNYSIAGSPASISILRNLSSVKNLVFENRKDIPNGVLTYAITSGDLDGDGKPDIVCSSIKDQVISVFRNTSTPGNISFAAKITYPTTDNAESIVIADMDGDGKPDISFVNYFTNDLSIYRNTSSAGVISFGPRQDFMTGLGPTSLVITDMNGDSKPDAVVANSIAHTISVFQNSSVNGTISFQTKDDFPTAANDPYGLCAGDLDQDGKPDIVITYNNVYSTTPSTVSFSIFRNTTSAGIISFGSKGNYGSGDTYHPAIADLTGDGMPDLVIPTPQEIFSYQNASGSGFISIGNPKKSYAAAPYFPGICDFDGDNKPDIAVSNLGMEWVSVLRNRVTEPGISLFLPDKGATGDTIAIMGVNFTGVTAVSFGGVPATSFSIINSTLIKAVVGAGTSGSVTVTGPSGTHSLGGFTYYFPPAISAFSPALGPTGTSVAIKGSHFTGTTAVSFGGVPAKSFTVNSDTSITAVVAAGASGNIAVTTIYGTAIKAGFTYLPPPAITLFTPTTGGPGTIVTITGNFFIGTTIVKFGASPVASFTVNSATSITATVYGGSTGPLYIETPNGKVSFGNFTYITPAAPAINSFSPASGPVGTLVTIKGSNFNPVASNNIVYFGATRGLITSASATDITVQVPPGSTNEPITVLNRTTYLSASSLQPFLVTFNGSNSFDRYSFAAKKDFQTSWIVGQTIAADMNNDGKPDIIYGANGGDGLDLMINTSTPGSVSFSPGIKCGYLLDGFWGVAALDIDGDGLLDIAATDNSSAIVPISKLCILRNTSSGGNISFTQFNFTANLSTQGLAVGDLNNDGKPDVIVANSGSDNVSVFINTSTPGNISFAAKKDFRTGRYTTNICIVDFDGDKKLDFVINNGSDQSISVFRNITNDSLSFEAPLTIQVAASGTTEYLATGDLDGDGKPDLAVTNAYYTNTVSVIKNTSVPGSISFAPRTDYPTPNDPMHVAFQDMNGDGKLDMVVANGSYGKSLSVFKNISSNSVISFDTRVDYSYPNGNNWFFALALCDIDGDNRPDITTSNQQLTIAVLSNQLGSFKELKVCVNGSADITSEVKGAIYKWQLNTGNGFNDISDNANFSGTTTSTLHLANIPSNWDGYLLRCKVDSIFSMVTGLTELNGLTASVNITATSTQICSGANATFTATPINGGTAPSYQWQVNGLNVGTNSNTFSTNTLVNNDRITLQLTSNESCITTPIVTSNIITETVKPVVTPSVAVSASTNIICTGNPITFTATPTNGGSAPSYQWIVNNINAGSNSNTFNISTLNNNDNVKVKITSNDACANPSTATSGPITITVNPAAQPSGKATTPSRICDTENQYVSFSSSNAPLGSIVQLWQNSNNSIFYAQRSQTYNGSTLDFSISPHNPVSSFFFKITPPSNTCFTTGYSDTATTITDFPVTPQIVLAVGSAYSGSFLGVYSIDIGSIYQWQVKDASGNWNDVMPAATGVNFKPSTTGTYRVKATKGQCVSYSNELAMVITAIDPVQALGHTILIYPNPTNGTLFLDSLKLTDKWKILDIVSLETGQTIMSFSVVNQTKLLLRLDSLSSGSYLAVLRKKDGSFISIKFIKK
jgi:hypothetical protein